MTLQFTSFHGDCTAESDCKETHLSNVIIGENYVYKFKKDVLFPFCDYSTFEKRLTAAWQEVLLNRRGARNIYCGIALFRREPSGVLVWTQSLLVTEQSPPNLNADEVAVVMQRIADDDFLEARLGRNNISSLISTVAPAIGDFLESCEKVIDSETYIRNLENAVSENNSSLAELADEQKWEALRFEQLRLTKDFQDNFITRHRPLIASRARTGWVVDGHGDLRLDHIAIVAERAQIIDCVEFNSALRMNDVCSELAFLQVSLETHGHRRLASGLTKAVVENIHDRDAAQLLPFFACYRALVRAKVHAIKLAQQGSAQSGQERTMLDRYLATASRYALGLEVPFLVLVGGLMGSGKSTLSAQLSKLIGAEVLSSDVIRKGLANRPLHAQERESFGTGIYDPQHTSDTYRQLAERSEEYLREGHPVIVDASFLRREHRQLFSRLGKRLGTIPRLLNCTVPRAVLLERLVQRQQRGNSVSEGRAELLAAQEAQSEPVTEEEGVIPVEVETTSLTPARLITVARMLG